MASRIDDLKLRFDALHKEYEEALSACEAAQQAGLIGVDELQNAERLLEELTKSGTELTDALESALLNHSQSAS
jgi:hypothetical protein